MQKEKVFTGNNEEEVWKKLAADIKANEESVEYHAVLIQNNSGITLDIDIDPGGGFENGDSSTRFTSDISQTSFRLAIHPQNFVDDIGKLLGLEDVIIGYPEFDKKFIIKTNNGGKTQTIFAEKDCREILESLDDFTLETTGNDENCNGVQNQLILNIDEGITDTNLLKKIYHAFFRIWTGIENIS
jgi:hypothetical protein